MKGGIVSTTIRCTCGAEAEGATPNIGETAQKTGFFAVWNVAHGIEALWLCPACAKLVYDAWTAIVTITKTDKISMAGFVVNYERRSEAKAEAKP